MSHTPSQQEVAAKNLRSDPTVKANLQQFLETDNSTNFLFIVRAWFIIALTICAAAGFFWNRADWGWNALWNLPVFLVALIVVGASQHQLAGAAHEAVHHTLFKNRKLNELAGDFLCAFPLLTSVYQFRLYHLAHHQFVNDPERDPDFALLKDSGHWMKFPVRKASFLWMMFRQIFIVELVRYILVRARYNTIGTHRDSPYQVKQATRRRIPERGAVFIFLFLIGNSIVVQKWGDPWMLLAFPFAAWTIYTITLLRLPNESFQKSKLKPVFHPRFAFMGQTAVFAFIIASLSFIQMSSGVMVLRVFGSLYYGAILTTFPFFLILRQVIQHGNGDRGWLSNTRVFQMNPLVRYAVFPFGMDYHLPHHMYATIPHYRLRKFHDFMMTREDYRKHCQVVDNYLVPDSAPPRNPTVVEVLGPEYTAEGSEIHIDDTVLDDWEVEEKDSILREGRTSKSAATAEHSNSEPTNGDSEASPESLAS